MSVGGQTSPEGDSVRRLRRQVEHAIEQLAALSGSSLSPGDFYFELLRKGLDGIDAPAGAIWLKSPQGFLQQQCQVNMAQIGLDDKPDGRLAHNQLLRYAFEKAKPGILGPRSRADGDKTAGNPTDYALALAPILNEESQTLGVLEIFQKPNWNPQDLVTYTIQVAGYASNFLRNTSNRRVAGQEQIYTQLEVFSRQVHGSLNPTEVSYLVANEGRRLIGCDRISVGIRHGRKTTIEAVSGADVVEKASTHIKRMRTLFDSVITWGEKLVYRGNRDETLPPKVLSALDEYLMEQNPKLLVVLPVRDDREKPKEKEVAKTVRSCLMMEVFDPPAQTNVLEQKLEVVAAHAAPALYNASEMKRVPLKPLWWPLMRLQQGLGGKARFWTIFGITALTMLSLALVFIKTPLKLDANGKLATLDRMYIYSPFEAQIMSFKVRPGDTVSPSETVAIMRKAEWAGEIKQLQSQYEGLNGQIRQIESLLSIGSEADKNQRQTERLRLVGDRNKIASQLANYENSYHCDLSRPGEFALLAPETKPSAGGKLWRILNRDFRDDLTGKTVSNTDPVLRVGNTEGGWEVILKIPQKHVGKLFKAFKENPEHDARGDFLWVDILTISEPTPAWLARGKLYRKDVTASGEQNRDDQNEADQVFTGYVRVNTPDIPKEYHVDESLLLTDVEVKAKIRCGDHALGYSLFYGVWEFIYEKIIFFF